MGGLLRGWLWQCSLSWLFMAHNNTEKTTCKLLGKHYTLVTNHSLRTGRMDTETPNEKTLEAFEETEKHISGEKRLPVFDTVEELREELSS